MAGADYYSGLWPTGEGMRRRQGPCCCCLWISCALLVAWLWRLGIGMGWGSFASSDVDATPAVAFSNLPKSPLLYCSAAQDNSSFSADGSLPVGDYVSVCLPCLSRDRIIKPEMTVLIRWTNTLFSLAMVMRVDFTGIWKWHRWFLWMYH